MPSRSVRGELKLWTCPLFLGEDSVFTPATGQRRTVCLVSPMRRRSARPRKSFATRWNTCARSVLKEANMAFVKLYPQTVGIRHLRSTLRYVAILKK